MKQIVIIGASNNREKFGNKAVRAYLEKGYVVYPINPKEDTIEGLKCYHSLNDLPHEVDLASSYLRPEVLTTMIDELRDAGVKKIYLNPGADSFELQDALRKKGIEGIIACSIVAIGVSPSSL